MCAPENLPCDPGSRPSPEPVEPREHGVKIERWRTDAQRKKLPRYPIPAFGLARLAVDASARGLGVGAQLLRYVLRLALEMSDRVGCSGVVVDAKPGAVAFYDKYGFVRFEAIEGESEARPRPTPMWLPIATVKRASGTSH